MDDETRWLNAEERTAWLSLMATVSLLEAALDRQLNRDAGMPHAYYQILAMLSETPGRTLRMGDLAAITQSSQSRLSHAVARLEANGWVRRTRCPSDRRSMLAQLTPAGFEALAAAAPGHVRSVRENLFDHLTAEQVRSLTEICSAALTHLAAGPGAAGLRAALAAAAS